MLFVSLTASCYSTSHMALHVFLQCAIWSSFGYHIPDQQHFVSLFNHQVLLFSWLYSVLPDRHTYIHVTWCCRLYMSATATQVLKKLPAYLWAIVSLQIARCFDSPMLSNAQSTLRKDHCMTHIAQCNGLDTPKAHCARSIGLLYANKPCQLPYLLSHINVTIFCTTECRKRPICLCSVRLLCCHQDVSQAVFDISTAMACDCIGPLLLFQAVLLYHTLCLLCPTSDTQPACRTFAACTSSLWSCNASS